MSGLENVAPDRSRAEESTPSHPPEPRRLHPYKPRIPTHKNPHRLSKVWDRNHFSATETTYARSPTPQRTSNSRNPYARSPTPLVEQQKTPTPGLPPRGTRRAPRRTDAPRRTRRCRSSTPWDTTIISTSSTHRNHVAYTLTNPEPQHTKIPTDFPKCGTGIIFPRPKQPT